MPKKIVAIGHKIDGPVDRPFVLNWAETGAQAVYDGSTSRAEDTAFSEVIGSIAAQGVSETVTSTQSGIDPGELIDTSF